MRRLFFLIVFFQFFFSCSYHEKFPEMVTYRVNQNGEEYSLEQKFLVTRENLPSGVGKGDFLVLDSLFIFRQKYLQKDEGFDLEKFRLSWERMKNSETISQSAPEKTLQWFQITGFLFQLIGEARFAGELEKIAWNHFADKPQLFDSLVSPYIFTKNVDHIHVNFFLPAEISYRHSLGGAVNIVQETNFPASGSIRLNFSMEIKRYIEVFIRIPEWAEGASVTVKGVKYYAAPGNYCIVAKKWKEGDVVEIEFPMENLPDYLKLYS